MEVVGDGSDQKSELTTPTISVGFYLLSMAEVVDNDAVEQILIRLDAKDLNRYKRVCKSWRSLITSPRFVKRHLNLSYNKDRHNNKLGHRRVSVFENPYLITNPVLLGSSNGLVCIEFCIDFIMTKLIVGNPLTREIRQLPPHLSIDDLLDVCWGFGYDSSRDDYKVIVGVEKYEGEGRTCFKVLSLKSNVWRDIGEKKYKSFSNVAGVLCNGALYWMIADQNGCYSIASYDLSLEKFKEIPLPNERCTGYDLGIMKDCLCVFGSFYADDVWLLKKYSVKESWEVMKIRDDDEMEYDTVHFLRFGLRKGEKASWFYRASECPCSEWMAAPLFVESLVSPHYI